MTGEIAGILQSAAVCKTIGQKVLQVVLFSKFRVMNELPFPPLYSPGNVRQLVDLI